MLFPAKERNKSKLVVNQLIKTTPQSSCPSNGHQTVLTFLLNMNKIEETMNMKLNQNCKVKELNWPKAWC